MAEFLLAVGSGASCPHGGPLQIVPSQARVLLGGLAAATVSDQFLVAGCAFSVPGPKPQPCVTARFRPAQKVVIGGAPGVLQSGGLQCFSAEQIPAGPPTVAATQTKVMGT